MSYYKTEDYIKLWYEVYCCDDSHEDKHEYFRELLSTCGGYYTRQEAKELCYKIVYKISKSTVVKGMKYKAGD